MNESFWKDRRVFLTGHTGFKGGWLALMLQALGARVYGYGLAPSTMPSLFHEADVASGIHSQLGDIRDLERLRSAVADARPEIVLHLAAQAIVSESFSNPLSTFQTNVIGTANLLEAMRGLDSIKAIVIVTSDKCYENREWAWSYRENEALGGNDPYSASKACTELVAASWRYSFFDQHGQAVIATARAGNVIGGGDWSMDRLIPDMVRGFRSKESVLIRNPHGIRPWQHVMEPLYGYLQLAERCATDGSFGQAWNFGPEIQDNSTVETVADMLTELWGEGAAWHTLSKNLVKEAGILKLDSTKARTLLHWQPRTGLREALKLTAQWYKSHASGINARQITDGQIRLFLNRS